MLICVCVCVCVCVCRGGETKLDVRQPAQFDDAHNSQVWRVAWNATGTVLASSGDDGCVRLWKGEEDSECM